MQLEYGSLIQDFSRLAKCFFGRQLRSVVLYGSVSRGTAKKESDIDILLVATGLPRSYHQRVKSVYPLLREVEETSSFRDLEKQGYNAEIKVILLSPEEARCTMPLFLDLVEDAEFIYDDGIMKEKLEELKTRMQALGSKRHFLPDGTWYWDLKPDLKLGEVFEL